MADSYDPKRSTVQDDKLAEFISLEITGDLREVILYDIVDGVMFRISLNLRIYRFPVLVQNRLRSCGNKASPLLLALLESTSC